MDSDELSAYKRRVEDVLVSQFLTSPAKLLLTAELLELDRKRIMRLGDKIWTTTRTKSGD